MKIKLIKNIAKEKQENQEFIRNDITFKKHPNKEKCWIYHGRMPKSSCWIYFYDDSIQIENVIVGNPTERGHGFGKLMISDIRQAFPYQKIWVDTWNCTRPFWQKMVQCGYVDEIANDYSWPCINTTCITCHPNRNVPRRRVFQ